MDNIDFPKNPKVSFIIRTYNEEKWLPSVLSTLFQQTFLDFEIILVDSKSSDKTLKVIEDFPIRKIIHLPKKEFNYSYALNLGIAEAWGEFVVILSGHSVPVSRTWLADGLRHFIDSKVAAVGGYDRPLPDASYQERLLSLNLGADTNTLLQNTPWLSNTNSLIRKSLWNVYCFDERITEGKVEYDFATEGCEDYDWASEMRSRGYSVIKDPLFNVYHSHGGLKRKTYFQRIERWNQILAFIDLKQRPSLSYTQIPDLAEHFNRESMRDKRYSKILSLIRILFLRFLHSLWNPNSK